MRALANTWAIFLRELSAFFLSPVAYIVVFLFAFSNGWLFFGYCVYFQHHPQQISQVVASTFAFAIYWAIPISPLLTMRLFAEEKRSGTMEMLMTAPVTETQVVVGKFLATHVFYMLIWSTVLLFVLVLDVLADNSGSGADWGPVWAVYLGLFFLGMMLNALGLLASTLSPNQLVAAVLALTGNLAFVIVSLGTAVFYDSTELQRFFEYLSFTTHFKYEYSRGIVDLRYFFYYLTLMGLFLFVSIRVVEARKWR